MKGELQSEIKEFLKDNDNENIIYHNCCNAAQREIHSLNININKNERINIREIPKLYNQKNNSKINQKSTRKEMIQKQKVNREIANVKNWFFEKLTKETTKAHKVNNTSIKNKKMTRRKD